jgi:hypothetical protein
LAYYLKYGKNSIAEDKKVIEKGVDENGNEFEKIIHINQIKPQSTTVVKMRTLEIYIGVKDWKS